MHTIVRAAMVYVILLFLFRVSGKRSLSNATTFDFVLLLIVSEATQQALIADDYSVTGSILTIVTLFAVDKVFSMLKQRFNKLDVLLEGRPVVVVQDGKPLLDRMKVLEVDSEDVMQAARELQGIGEMHRIRYAVLEKNGSITVIPREG